MKNILTKGLSLTCLAGLLTAGSASALNLSVGLTDPYAVGDVINGLQGFGGQVSRDVIMVNNLLTVGLGSSAFITSVDGNKSSTEQYQRSLNVFNPLPAATATGASFAATPDGYAGFSGNSMNLTLSGGFTYLVAAYDGPNGGVQVWNIASLAAGTQLVLPRYAHPANVGNPDTGPLVADTYYQMTGWSLLNPGPSVPDGGTTALLLGAALSGLAMLRRKLA